MSQPSALPVKAPLPPNTGNDPPQPSSRHRTMKVLNALACVVLFGIVLGSVRWLTPIEPFARLTVDSHPMFMLFSPDGRLAITSGEDGISGKAGPLRVWDVEQGQLRFTVAADWKAIETVEFSPNSELFAAHEKEGDLKLWSTQTGQEVGLFRL